MGMISWEDIRELRHPYYFINFIMSISFVSCKLIPPLCNLVFNGNSEFEMKQNEILFFMLIVMMMRARRTGSMHFIAYLNNSFLYCKVANCVLWFFANKAFGGLYILLFLIQALLFPQPSYSGPQRITYFADTKSFKEEISKTMYWLVEFYTPYNACCINFSSVFAELSNKYSLDNLKFGKVDVSRLPDLAKEFRLDDSSFSKQLPTLIMFKEGKGLHYRPLVERGGKLVKFNFNRDNVVNTFDLNNLHKECKEKLKNKQKQKVTSTEHIKSE